MEKILAATAVTLLTLLSYASGSKNIFLLGGQSNMAGRGGLFNNTWDTFVPPECGPSPKISRLNRALSWEQAQEPLHEGIDLSGVLGIGPGMPFAHALLLKNLSDLQDIGLVPCAEGGTSINDWTKGGRLYGQLMTRAAAALKDGGILWGLLWYQGEEDARIQETAELYKTNFEEFIFNVRTDLSSPKLPVVEVALASGGQNPWRDIVRKAQFDTAAENANVSCVDALGYPLEDDKVHLTTAAQVKLGGKMAVQFLNL